MKLRSDNENYYAQVKKAFDERQVFNSQILMLEQINEELKQKEQDNNKMYVEQIHSLKE